MHVFHAWIELRESPQEISDGLLAEGLAELEELAAADSWHDAVFEIRHLNGGHFFTATGFVNRRRSEGERLDLFLATIARSLPGSYGLVYEWDDEMPAPYGPNAYRVKVMARGQITERYDPFLSPIDPVVEDNGDLDLL
jgi:hypothetical protein